MNDTNNKRTQRTPSEIIAETEAKLQRLRIKEAKKSAQTNPEGAVKQAKKWISESHFDWERKDPVGSELRAWAGGCDWIDIKQRKIQN